jgi:NADH dehydrogenase
MPIAFSYGMDTKKHIVVIGGGFAGLNFLRHLYNNNYYDVTLIDKNNYNYFTPLLYQVATGFLEPSSICYPFRKLFKGKGIRFRMGTFERVDTNANDSIRKNAVSLKGIDDALYMRNKLIKTLEKASVEKAPREKPWAPVSNAMSGRAKANF